MANKKCWFRLLTTFSKAFTGMDVVDIQRWDQSKRNAREAAKRSLDTVFDDTYVDNAPDIRVMADLIAKPLRLGTIKFREGPHPTARYT